MILLDRRVIALESSQSFQSLALRGIVAFGDFFQVRRGEHGFGVCWVKFRLSTSFQNPSHFALHPIFVAFPFLG